MVTPSMERSEVVVTWTPEELAAWREELLTATGAAAERILSGNAEAPCFREALALLGRAARVSRVYVFVVHGDDPQRPLVSQRYEWCAPGVKSEMDNPDLTNFPLVEAGFRRWLEELRADRPLFGPVREMPDAERAVFEPQGILSFAVLPVLRYGDLWGFIGFDDCVREQVWTNDSIACLRVSARVLGATLERREYQAKSESLEAEYRQLVESLDDVIFRADAGGAWTLLSGAWEAQTGWSVAASLGHPATQFMVMEETGDVGREWRELLAGRRQSCREEIRWRRADGSFRWMLMNARSRPAAGDAGMTISGTLTDIEAAKETEAALIAARLAAEEASRAKSEFLGTMSHELCTPLNAVLGLSESLLENRGAFDAERTQRYLGLIQQSGRQLLRQINDILELGRIEAGKVQPLIAPMDPGALATSVAEEMRREAERKRIEVAVVRPSGAWTTRGDERLVRQILRSLAENAVKFTPEGGRVELRVSAGTPAGWELTVTDNGIGVPGDKLGRLFKPFSQVDSSTSRKYGGSGLGLALVDRLTRLLGGTVTVESEPGRGSRFRVVWPGAVPVPADGAGREKEVGR